jgi:hypothetical protein
MLFWSGGNVLLLYIYYTKENVNVALVFFFIVLLDHIKNYITALNNHYRSGGTKLWNQMGGCSEKLCFGVIWLYFDCVFIFTISFSSLMYVFMHQL